MSSDQRRPYRLVARAERQRDTRDRIVAATQALHRTVGPAQTTIADVARGAGVQRLTVYTHFPELTDLLAACQARFLGEKPPPDLGPSGNGVPLRQLQRALTALYAWFRDNRDLQHHVHHDRHLVPELDELMRRNADPMFDAAAAAHAAQLSPPGRRRTRVRALVRLALDYRGWEVLAAQGLDDAEIAALMCRAVRGVAA